MVKRAKVARSVAVAQTRWRGREAFALSNHLIRVTTLIGGGHIAEFSLVQDSPAVSPLWSPPWETMEPYAYREQRHRASYGSTTEGKLLSGIAGHNICLDYFGSPSAEEAQQGLSQHGEAPNVKWVVGRPRLTDTGAVLRLRARLRAARLEFEREIAIAADEPVVYFRETAANLAKTDHFFHWAQHVTLGPPFLAPGEVRVGLPGTRGMTFPHGYDEGKALLRSGEAFAWPEAPRESGGTVDLSRPLSREGLGLVAGVLLDRESDPGYIAAVNVRLRLVIAYCFRRSDFPWVTLWEENKAISAPPWCSRGIALGLEFGTTPLPVPRRENFLYGGPLFSVPTSTFVAARALKTVRYAALLSKTPDGFTRVGRIHVEPGAAVIGGGPGEPVIRVPASRINEFLAN
jgi:hypothetical protein